MDEDEFIDAAPVDYLEPGETATVDVDGTPVTIANADGVWCAFESNCPHQATPLGGLSLMRRTLLQCPEHGSVSTCRPASASSRRTTVGPARCGRIAPGSWATSSRCR